MTHEDERRSLTSIPYKTGEIKIIVAKQDCELGNHFHKVKTEIFILIEGDGLVMIDGHKSILSVRDEYIVRPLEIHTFFLKEGSVLICFCSEPYNQKDDYHD